MQDNRTVAYVDNGTKLSQGQRSYKSAVLIRDEQKCSDEKRKAGGKVKKRQI